MENAWTKEQGGAPSREAPCQNGNAPPPSPRLHWGHEGEWGWELETHETRDPAAEKPPEGTDSWQHRSATLTSAPSEAPWCTSYRPLSLALGSAVLVDPSVRSCTIVSQGWVALNQFPPTWWLRTTETYSLPALGPKFQVLPLRGGERGVQGGGGMLQPFLSPVASCSNPCPHLFCVRAVPSPASYKDTCHWLWGPPGNPGLSQEP